MDKRLYPLRLRPEYKTRVWGVNDLSPIYDKKAGGEPIGEVWIAGDDSIIENGTFSGKNLQEITRELGSSLLGDSQPHERFPLLIKFLFPKEKLSVQVHPDDDGARALGMPCGKTECWYVLHAEPGAFVSLGLKQGTTHEQVKAAIRNNTMEELLNHIPVHAGDMIYVDAGTVHAIGPGSVIVETQQNSDTTYRLYDYGRPRELHIEEGLKATRLTTNAGKTKHRLKDGCGNLVSSPCFTVDAVEFGQTHALQTNGAVQCLIAIDGDGVVQPEGGEPVEFRRGDAVIVPAALKQVSITSNGAKLRCLVSSVPRHEVALSATTLG